MTSFALILALLGGGPNDDPDQLSPYRVEPAEFEFAADDPSMGLVGQIDLIVMFAIVIQDDLTDISGVDLDVENVFAGSAAIWYHMSANSALEFKFAYIEKTKIEDASGVEIDDVDSYEASIAYVHILGASEKLKGYVLVGGGVHQWQGTVILEDENDAMALAGGGVILKLGERIALVFDARYVVVFVDDADEQMNWHAGVGLAISFGS